MSRGGTDCGPRVCIPIKFQAHGGGHYFLQAFANALPRSGWSVTADIDASYDVLFTNSWMVPRSRLFRGLRRNPSARVVQRVDGAAQDYGRTGPGDRRQGAISRLVDQVIFQSEYCRHSTRIKFPVISQDGPVIHNPVDTEVFTPDGQRMDLPDGPRVACITWSTNPYKGAAAIYKVARSNPGLRFILCGQYPDAPHLPNLTTLGVLGRKPLAQVLRSSDVLLTFSRNEACPNHVLEAMACGLPVLYGDSGAMSEIIQDCGLPVTETDFRSKLDHVLTERHAFGTRARARILDKHQPGTIFARYMDALRDCLERPTRVGRCRRSTLAHLDPLLHPIQFAKAGWR